MMNLATPHRVAGQVERIQRYLDTAAAATARGDHVARLSALRLAVGAQRYLAKYMADAAEVLQQSLQEAIDSAPATAVASHVWAPFSERVPRETWMEWPEPAAVVAASAPALPRAVARALALLLYQRRANETGATQVWTDALAALEAQHPGVQQEALGLVPPRGAL